MTPAAATKKRRKFDPQTFLSTIDGGRTISSFAKKQTIFAQGDLSDAVFYIQEGRVRLTAYLLTRNIRYEEALVDQLFNSSEKRLARILLLLAHFGKGGNPEVVIPQDQSGNSSGDGGHNSLASQLPHEQV
jgi:hypothetical protein